MAARHAEDHVHLVATPTRRDWQRPKTWNDFHPVREAYLEALVYLACANVIELIQDNYGHCLALE